MKILSNLFPILVLIAMVLFIGKFHISFKPFSIGLPEWFRALGYFLFIAGGIIIVAEAAADSHHKGVMKGIDMSYKSIHGVLDDTFGVDNIDAIKAAVKEVAEEEEKE